MRFSDSPGLFLSHRKLITPVFDNIPNFLFSWYLYGSSFIAIITFFDRWIAVIWPFKYRVLMTKKSLCVKILLSWLMAALVVSGMVVSERAGNRYGSLYVDGTFLIVEKLILVYLYYCIIFFLCRKQTSSSERSGMYNRPQHKVDGMSLLPLNSSTDERSEYNRAINNNLGSSGQETDQAVYIK